MKTKIIIGLAIIALILSGCTTAPPTTGTEGTGEQGGEEGLDEGTGEETAGAEATEELIEEIDTSELDALTEELDQVANIGGSLSVGDQIEGSTQTAAGSAAGVAKSASEQETPTGSSGFPGR